MAQSDVGRTIAEIKARSGLTWDALARRLGASSGDYVRKVATGARPGYNLAAAVDELMRAGRVQTPVERRRTKSGELARVRASRATGAPSRRPEPVQLDPTRGYMSAGPAGSLRWSGEYSIDDLAGIRRAIRAARDAHKRVSFRLHYVSDTGLDVYVQVGGKAGYDPRVALRKLLRNADVISWLESQSKDRRYVQKYGTLVLVGVEVYAV